MNTIHLRQSLNVVSVVKRRGVIMEQYLKPKDIATILGFSSNKTYALINRPDFPKMKIGRQYLIPAAKFEAYMNSRCYKITPLT